jgi:hypothetical protein
MCLTLAQVLVKRPQVSEIMWRGLQKNIFLHNLQLRYTETFYEFLMTNNYFMQERYKDMSLSLKITSFMLKTSEQMKYRYALKLCSENVTRSNLNIPTKFFL